MAKPQNPFHLALLCTLGLTAAACAPFPEVAAKAGSPGPYPTLLPIDELLAQADAVPDDPGAGLSARAARLKARAAALERP